MNLFKTFILLLLAFCSTNALSMSKDDIEMERSNTSKKPLPLIETKIFNFDSSKKSDKSINVLSADKYEENTGYGFDFETAVNAAFSPKGLSITKSTYFSVKVPEGNYKVKITFGSDNKDSNITVKAESRRVMIDQLSIKKGKSEYELSNEEKEALQKAEVK